MKSGIVTYLKLAIQYFRVVLGGVFRIYAKIAHFVFKRFQPFTRIEILYIIMILLAMVLTALDWRGYDMIINSEVIHHGISTDDFLVFLCGFLLMGVPSFIKFLTQSGSRKLFIFFFFTGLTINIVTFFLNALYPERIAKTLEASFTIWFYLFGVVLLVSGIMGVLSILSMPSTHSKSEWLSDHRP